MVPLIRMNWRSRPTCSSIRRAASLPSQRSIVGVMIVVTSVPYRSTAKTAASAARPSSRFRSASSAINRSANAEISTSIRCRTAPSGSVSEVCSERRSAFQSETLDAMHLRVVEQPVLEPLGALLRRRVVQQVLGELGQHRVQRLPGMVVRVVADVRDPLHQLAVHPGDDRGR